MGKSHRTSPSKERGHDPSRGRTVGAMEVIQPLRPPGASASASADWRALNCCCAERKKKRERWE
jgi:hypothetical protein